VAMVDGVPIGNTPTYWAGEANGREHTFSFELAGYAGQFYRFVPVASGVIHVRLDAVVGDIDAGTPETPRLPTPPAPPPPPPTIIGPDAAVANPAAVDAAVARDPATPGGPTP